MRFRTVTLRSMRSRKMSLPARPLLVARVTGVLAVTLGGFALLSQQFARGESGSGGCDYAANDRFSATCSMRPISA